MIDFDQFKVENEKQQKVDAIIIKLQGNTSDQVKEFAKGLVEHRYPFPAYRGQRSGENPRSHSAFVASRLQLVWAMRRWATELLDPADPYFKYLTG